MMRRQSKSSANADRIAIRQALAILEEEGVIIEETSNLNIDEGLKLKIRHKNQASSRRNDKAIRRASLNSKQQQQSDTSSNISKTSSAAAPAAAADVDSSSTSHDGSSTVNSCSYSCSSLKSDDNREVGGKGKRRSHTRRNSRRSHPHAHQKSKKEPEGSSSTRDAMNKLNVRFSKYDQINHIPHINDLSPEEINHCWMNEEDYQKIRSRSYKLIDMMDDPQKRYPISADTMIVNQHLVCIRGLEGNTSHCLHERDQLHRKLQQAIFQIQQQQQEAGIIDAQAIRQVSTNYSKKSMKIARFTGISDRGNNVTNR